VDSIQKNTVVKKFDRRKNPQTVQGLALYLTMTSKEFGDCPVEVSTLLKSTIIIKVYFVVVTLNVSQREYFVPLVYSIFELFAREVVDKLSQRCMISSRVQPIPR